MLQNDIHTPAATVKEALIFSARLRLPASISDDKVSVALGASTSMLLHKQASNQCIGYDMWNHTSTLPSAVRGPHQGA
jgi:hypothetical protein